MGRGGRRHGAGRPAEAETYALGNFYLFTGENIRVRKTKRQCVHYGNDTAERQVVTMFANPNPGYYSDGGQ